LQQLRLLDDDDDDFEGSEEYTVAVDIWALGEITFRALTGEQPFRIKSLRAYIKKTSPFPTERLQAHGVSKEGCDFLKSLMTSMPKDRLTAIDALSHVWIEPQKPPSARVSTEMQRYLFSRQFQPSGGWLMKPMLSLDPVLRQRRKHILQNTRQQRHQHAGALQL
jgi:serine/threonine protein kinase